MTRKTFQTFIYTSLILLILSLFMLSGVFFVAIFLSSLYILIGNIIVKYCNKLSEAALGVVVALSCAFSPFLLYLLMPILHPLKF